MSRNRKHILVKLSVFVSTNRSNKIPQITPAYIVLLWLCDLNIVSNVIEIAGLEREYHFYQLSDMHVLFSPDLELAKPYGERNKNWTPKKNGFNPLYGFDFILNYLNDKDIDGLFITGDLIDNFNIDTANYVSDKIDNINYPIYFVPGNHEGHIGGDLFYARRFYNSLSSFSKIPLDCGYQEFDKFIIMNIDDLHTIL